jgi:AraC family transcriptional regulator
MAPKADCDPTVVSLTGAAGYNFGHEELPRLISAAAAMLDCDRATARACLQRAMELVSVTREGCPIQSTTCIRGGLAPWQRRVVTSYIAANLGATIRVSDLARVARLSVGHFFRAFRESFGEPPLAHVARRRIQQSQSLLLSSEAPISQIALECGMHDQSHFTRVFHHFVGVNPGLWRRQCSAGEASTEVSNRMTVAVDARSKAEIGSHGLPA